MVFVAHITRDCMSNQQLVDFINEQTETVSIYSLITFKQTCFSDLLCLPYSNNSSYKIIDLVAIYC